MKEREKPVHGDDNPKPREVKRRLKATKRISRRKRLEFEEVELPLQVAIIGGGVAGMEAASVLAEHRCPVILFEARPELGVNVKNKYKIFPDFSDAGRLVETMTKAMDHPLITVNKDTEIIEIIREPDAYTLLDNKGVPIRYRLFYWPAVTSLSMPNARRNWVLVFTKALSIHCSSKICSENTKS